MYEDDGTPNEQFKRFLDEMGLTIGEGPDLCNPCYEIPIQNSLFPGILDTEESYTMPTEVNQFHIDDAVPAREWYIAEIGNWPQKPWLPDSFDEFWLRTLCIDPI